MIQRSTDRILTTHTGSLPRPADLIEMIRDAARTASPWTRPRSRRASESAVAETVQKQIDAGIDIVSDGEEGKPSYATYVKDRLTGFGGERTHDDPRPGRGARLPGVHRAPHRRHADDPQRAPPATARSPGRTSRPSSATSTTSRPRSPTLKPRRASS